MVYQFGGGCHGHPDGTEAGARAIRQAIDAELENSDLKEFAKTNIVIPCFLLRVNTACIAL